MNVKIPGVQYETRASLPWEEFYISYEKEYAPVFKDFGIDLDFPFWDLKITPQISHLIKNIIETSHQVHEIGAVDNLDRLCEQLIFKSYITAISSKDISDVKDDAIRKIASYIEFHYLEEVSLKELSKKYGLPERTFLRYWNKIFNMPPSRYIANLKIKEAKRFLIDTDLRINEIAENLNFEDPYYFSRKFKIETGLSPQQYRKKFSSE